MKNFILVARARVRLRATTSAQMDQVREQINNDELFGLLNNLHHSNSLDLAAVRVTQTSPSVVMVLQFNPASGSASDDSGLNEDALSELGRFADQARKRLSGFWCSLTSNEAGAAFTLTIGTDS